MANEQLVNITLKAIYFFIPEVLVWVFIEKHSNKFKFRFRKKNGNLKPFAKTSLVALLIFAITFFSQDIFSFLFGKSLKSWLLSFGNSLTFIALALFAFSFLWIYNYLLEKKWDKISWILLVISGGLIVIYFILNF